MSPTRSLHPAFSMHAVNLNSGKQFIDQVISLTPDPHIYPMVGIKTPRPRAAWAERGYLVYTSQVTVHGWKTRQELEAGTWRRELKPKL